jgi:hypothetical protein
MCDTQPEPRACRRAANRRPAPESTWPRQANPLKPKPRRASPGTLRSHAAEEEKDQSSTANPVYSFPGRRDHHLGSCLPLVARDGRPAPYPTLHGESSIMRESPSVPASVALALAFLLALASARGADVNNAVTLMACWTVVSTRRILGLGARSEAPAVRVGRVLGLSPLRGDRTRDALHSGEVAGFSAPQDSHPNAQRPLRAGARTATATRPSPDGDRPSPAVPLAAVRRTPAVAGSLVQRVEGCCLEESA